MKTKINILSTKVIMALTVMIVFAISANAQINYGTNTVTGTNASAIGDNNTASGNSSFVGGIDSEALGQYSLAYGDSAKAWSRNGIALGKQVSVFGEAFFQEGVVLGGTVSLNGNWIKTGNYGSGGIFIDNNNHVGIGTDTPSASLDINGNIKANSIEVASMNITTMTMETLTVTSKIEAGEIRGKGYRKMERRGF